MNIVSAQSRRQFFGTVSRVAAATTTLSLSGFAHAYDENSTSDINIDSKGLALKGHDPVSYHASAGPKLGKKQFTATHAGATYRFATAANRDTFISNPAKYAPQYGGFCAMGVALQKKLDVDPKAWRVVDGKLYLNVSKEVQKRWLDDVPGNLRQAELNWPRLKDLAPKGL
jgi:YHS domain-containing protein